MAQRSLEISTISSPAAQSAISTDVDRHALERIHYEAGDWDHLNWFVRLENAKLEKASEGDILPSTIIPAVDVPSVNVTGAFAMTGRFFLFPTPLTPFELDLVGQGTVIHHLIRDTSLSPAAGILYNDEGFLEGPLVYQLTAAVPEPATSLLLLMGIAGIFLWRKRYRNCQSGRCLITHLHGVCVCVDHHNPDNSQTAQYVKFR